MNHTYCSTPRMDRGDTPRRANKTLDLTLPSQSFFEIWYFSLVGDRIELVRTSWRRPNAANAGCRCLVHERQRRLAPSRFDIEAA